MSGLTKLSLMNRAVVALLCITIVGVGLYSAGVLRQELIPSLRIPTATVMNVYPGATTDVVAQQVTDPMESALRGVDGVTEVSSVTTNDMAQVTVQWDYNENATEMESKLRTAVQGVGPQLPDDVTSTVVVGSFDALPIVYYAVSSDGDPAQLAEDLRAVAIPQLKQIPGVRDAFVAGETDREVVVTLRQDDLDRLGIDPSQISQLFQANNLTYPGGQLERDGEEMQVQIGGKLTSVEAVAGIMLQGTDGAVPLRDVADVVEQPAEASSIARVNGEASLSLGVTKLADANTVEVARLSNELMPQIMRDIGGGVSYVTIFDQAPFIEQSIEDLAVEGVLGLVMAVVIILVFLWSARSTIITAISIPMSLLIALIAMWLTDNTLNLLTLSALTVSVGRVVDDSIVVIENIRRHQALSPPADFGPKMILRSVGEVAGAITSSTIITVAVFLPIATVSGETGELFRPFALTMSVALLGSLLVALTIVPVLAYWFLRPTVKQERAWMLAQQEGAAETVKDTDEAPSRMQKAYLPVLGWTLRHRWVTLAIAAVVFVGTLGSTALLKTDFIGDLGETSLTVSTELPAGTSLAETDAVAQRIEEIVADHDGIETYQTTVGGGDAATAGLGMGGGGSNTASISITMAEGTPASALQEELRVALEAEEGLGEIQIQTAGGMGADTDVSVIVQGRDADRIEEGARLVEQELRQQSLVTNVSSDLGDQYTVLQVDVDAAKAAEYGMNQATVGVAVQQAMGGQQIGQVEIDATTQRVVLRSRTPIETKEELEQLLLPVTQLQNAKAQQDAAERVTEQQDEMATEQREQANQEFEDGLDQIAEQRDALDEQIEEMTEQLEAAEAMPLPEVQIPQQPLPDLTPPTDPAQLEEWIRGLLEAQRQQQEAAQRRAAEAQQQQIAAQQEQLAQMREGLEQLKEQREALDEQMSDMIDQRDKSQQQQERSEDLQQQAEDAREARGDPIPLSEVATVKEVQGPAAVHRIDGNQSITINATPVGADLGAVTTQLEQALAGLDMPDGVTYEIGGISQQQTEAFEQLGIAMAIAVAIVYVVMVATFKSLIQPAILLVSVPFAATGAILALLVTDTALGIPSMIGLLMLIGIVVTNAIVLIDLVNRYRDRGDSIEDAITHGARLRLRPIVMTALATMMALVPMGLGLTGGGVFISQSLALVTIGGLGSSTLLTLLLVPVLYDLIERARVGSAERRERKVRAGITEPLPADGPSHDEGDQSDPERNDGLSVFDAEEAGPETGAADADEAPRRGRD